ncbi:M66 family metalloprotease [Lysobacter sp. 5GHs7-4]|uniref:M66 family metalloprotease n=1 Tax=Lysobacter sp. 5GHs7-4 TaxID=2904253 RepID=UPI001E49BCCA|nr:M66 family metalloprotease [Lysobacter sp. 5GHs7-4]UHQ23289.1 M66 family metalloprotease [Lysobacter sp. 5GHs7-4]
MRTHRLAAALTATLCLIACTPGAQESAVPGQEDAAAAGAASGASMATPNAPQAVAFAAPLEIAQLHLAQTHVMPEAGLQWTLANAKEELHAIGNREALMLVKLAADNAINPQIEAWRDGQRLGAVALTGVLPPTEASGPAHPYGGLSATLPASWLAPGLQLRASADNYTAGAFRTPSIGADSPVILRVLPFYLFGANELNSIPLATTAVPDAATVDELYAKWPVASVVAQNHPARLAQWPILVVGPSSGRPAYVAHNTNEEQAGFELMGAALGMLGGLLRANGESDGPVQYYAPLIMFDANRVYRSPGGGLGTVGGDTGVGDHHYRGIFVHEQGHAMGLPHQDDGYKGGRYPYLAGSLNGSVWGYDSVRKQMLAPFVPATASRYTNCRGDTFAGTPRQLDAQGRCIKQDPMQSGSGDEAAGYRFATFSDYSTAMMQRHFEGVARNDDQGRRVYDGGSIVADAAFPGGYKRWDSLDRRWVNVERTTTDKGLYGLDGGLPLRRDVPVHAIAITYSLAGTPQVSQIYPMLSYRGNLLRTIDPTDAAQRASIVPNTGPIPWYCHASGCDYSLRLTYVDGSVRHVLLQGGFRSWWGPTTAPPASASDPKDDDSFRTWVINVPGETMLRKIELLDTPRAWEGLPANPAVLATRENIELGDTPHATNGVPTAPGVPVAMRAQAANARVAEGACVELATIAAPRSAWPAPQCAGAQTEGAQPPQPVRFDMREVVPRMLRR